MGSRAAIHPLHPGEVSERSGMDIFVCVNMDDSQDCLMDSVTVIMDQGQTQIALWITTLATYKGMLQVYKVAKRLYFVDYYLFISACSFLFQI